MHMLQLQSSIKGIIVIFNTVFGLIQKVWTPSPGPSRNMSVTRTPVPFHTAAHTNAGAGVPSALGMWNRLLVLLIISLSHSVFPPPFFGRTNRRRTARALAHTTVTCFYRASTPPTMAIATMHMAVLLPILLLSCAAGSPASLDPASYRPVDQGLASQDNFNRTRRQAHPCSGGCGTCGNGGSRSTRGGGLDGGGGCANGGCRTRGGN